MSTLYDDFVPTMTGITNDDPRLDFLDRDELIALLPQQLQREVARAEWAWANIENIAHGWNHDGANVIVDPWTGEAVNQRRFSREEILLLFDPPMHTDTGMSEEDELLAYAAGDPVVWTRVHLHMNPRIYQILILRDPAPRKVLRLGRRCGKSASFAMDMLHKCRTNDGYICMLVAPMKSQCEVVWKMLKEFLGRNEFFSREFQMKEIHSREAPYYEMTFPNGSIIKMFTSGVKSKNHGDSIRGQEADSLYLDEVDLMSPEDRPAFTAIMRDTGRPFDKTQIVASTPNGRRDMLYEYCTTLRDTDEQGDLAYREYYFPTHADLNYSPRDDKEQKALLTAEGYQHEILALFGEETTGVFLKAHIDRAQQHISEWKTREGEIDYGYGYMQMNEKYQHKQHSKLIIGVDWDKFGAGVNIIMAEADYNLKNEDNPRSGRITPIARWELQRSHDVLTRATEMVKELYSRFSPNAIYIDRGYGDMQYEDLTLAAEQSRRPGGDARCINLDKVLRGVHFNQKVIIYDPITNEEVGKPAKDYMVSLTIKMFENDEINLNARDYEAVPGPTDIIKQFEGYQIVRRTSEGKPVYEPASEVVGDHALDAFMLCIMAMHQEWGAFAQPEQHARPMSVPFNIMDISGEKISAIKDDQERPDNYRIQRTNIKAGRMSHGGGGRRLRRKGF